MKLLREYKCIFSKYFAKNVQSNVVIHVVVEVILVLDNLNIISGVKNIFR